MLEEKNLNLTPIGQLGEFGLIGKIRADFEELRDGIVKGIGDDAAVYETGGPELHIVSTDLLVEGVHFDLSYVPLRHLGYKSVVVNVSDICAMNGDAFGITVSVAMSSRFTVEAVEEFYAGVKIACEEYGVTLLGGDTSSSRLGLVISVTVLGKGSPKQISYRSGAKENDLICVSGDLGAAYAGLQILEREKAVYVNNPEMQPDLGEYTYVVGRQLRPVARQDVVRKLRELKVTPTAMIDVSDGLASDLLHITRESGVGAVVFEEKIPMDHQTTQVAEEFDIHPVTYAMNGGEDYELLFTLPLAEYEKIKDVKDIFIIGHIMDAGSGVHLMSQSGQLFEITAQGWNHFGNNA